MEAPFDGLLICGRPGEKWAVEEREAGEEREMGEITQQWSIFCNGKKKRDKGREVQKRGGGIRDCKVREAGVPLPLAPLSPITVKCWGLLSIITSSQLDPFTHLPYHWGIPSGWLFSSSSPDFLTWWKFYYFHWKHLEFPLLIHTCDRRILSNMTMYFLAP